MPNTPTFTKKKAMAILTAHLGDEVVFELDRIATKSYAIYLPETPKDVDPMSGVMALRRVFPDYQFSLL